MGSGDLALSVQDADTCAGCTIVLGDNISSTSTLTRKMFPTQQKMFDPSDDPNDFNGSHMVNRKTHGGLTKFFLFPSIPFALNLSVTIKASGATLPLASGNMTHMSVYHPFPLRIEGQQYDACFQIGEFGARNKMKLRPPLEHIVFDFGPLVIGTGVVVLIPLASGSNLSGPGAKFVNSFAGLMPGAANGVSIPSLKIADILDVSRPFYTWKNKDGTRVIVMAEPVIISDSNMRSIQTSTPATPPADAIREIQPTQYKPVAPPPRPPARRILQPPVDLTIIGESKRGLFIEVLKTTGYVVAAFFVIWLAIKFAKSDTGRNVVEGIGAGLARLWRGLGGASVRVGQGIRTGAAAAGSAASAAAGAAGSAASAAGSAIGSAASAAGQGIRTGVGAAGSAIGSAASAAGQGIRTGATAAAEAAGSASRGIRSVAARGLGVGRAPLVGRLPTADELKARRATRDATAAADRERTARLVAANKAKRLAAKNGTFQVQNPLLAKSPAKPADNAAAAGVGFLKPAPKVGNAPRSLLPAKKDVDGNFSQQNTLQKALAAKRAAAAPRPAAAPKRRNIGPIEETDEERLDRRARETSLAPFRPNLKTQYLRKTGAVAGGRRRRRRMKTGRRI